MTKLTGATLPKREDFEDIFNCLDTDGDQTISKEEYKVLTGKMEELFQDLDITIIYMGNQE